MRRRLWREVGEAFLCGSFRGGGVRRKGVGGEEAEVDTETGIWVGENMQV